MKDKDPNVELESDIGRFRLEFRRLRPEMDSLIEASECSVEIKAQCHKWIESVSDMAEKLAEDVHPYDTCSEAVFRLRTILNPGNAEQMELFTALADVLASSRDSALGWKPR
jgi:NAD-specific glutamate dehydrogenase